MKQGRTINGNADGYSFLWRSKKSNRFERRYKKLSEDMAKKADEAIITLLSSPRPEILGIRKSGKINGLLAWELGDSCRILYRPLYEEKTVEFYRICSHNEVYHA